MVSGEWLGWVPCVVKAVLMRCDYDDCDCDTNSSKGIEYTVTGRYTVRNGFR